MGHHKTHDNQLPTVGRLCRMPIAQPQGGCPAYQRRPLLISRPLARCVVGRLRPFSVNHLATLNLLHHPNIAPMLYL